MKYSDVKSLARELRKNQTKAEKVFWEKVRNRKFHNFKFNRQYIIQYQDYGYFIPDFYCHSRKLIVELDGKIHLKQVQYDQMREDILRELGYSIIRFKNEEVLNDWNKVELKLLEQLTPNPSLPKRGE